MQTTLLVGVKSRFSLMFMRSWQRDVRVALQGQSPPGTDRVALCARRSQMKGSLFQQTRHNKQAQAQSLRHSQIYLLYPCLALQGPNLLSLQQQASNGAALLFFTGNGHRILNLEIKYLFYF